jgi:hypothetical protein
MASEPHHDMLKSSLERDVPANLLARADEVIE